MIAKDELIKEMKSMFNDIGLVDIDVVRLVGFHEDPSDYYYHVRSWKPFDEYIGPDWYHTCVGKFVTFKGKLDKEDYDYLDRIFTIRGIPPEKEFLLSKSDQDPFIKGGNRES